MGRVTNEQMAAYCPTATNDYAATMNKTSKVVAWTTTPGR